ncbi:MAG: hypothetical protein LBJ57_07175 [Prevotellaceae bacterium]|jgi:hypothetical protein|nr:hypothetical protein [Prevotellaceae bacterium]
MIIREIVFFRHKSAEKFMGFAQLTPDVNVTYLMDKAYADFEALYRINQAAAFFVTGAKSTMKYDAIEQNFSIDEATGLRTDKTVMLTVAKSKKLYPEKLRLVEFYDSENDLNKITTFAHKFYVTTQ